MADVFISYASEDRERARVLAGTLEEIGWTVWWDREIPIGKTFTEVIEAELDAARCVIVLWSAVSVASRWVKREAKRADQQKKLFPVLIEAVTPPWVFEELQACDLIHWDGSRADRNFLQLAEDMGRILGVAPRLAQTTPARDEIAAPERAHGPATVAAAEAKPDGDQPSRRKLVWYAAGAAVLLAVVAAGWLLPRDRGTATVSARLAAEKRSIAPGEAVTLMWKTAGAKEVWIEPGVGSVEGNGSMSVSPGETTTYVLVAEGPGGTARDEVEVAVVAAEAGIDKSIYTVYVLGIPNAENAIRAMREAGYPARQYGPAGRAASGYQVISIGAEVPHEVAQELLGLARRRLSELRYIVLTDDRRDLNARSAQEKRHELMFGIANSLTGRFRRVTPVPDSGWRRLMAAEDDEAFRRVVRAYYVVE